MSKLTGIERVRRARSQLITGKQPFYGCLALNLDLEASTEFPTMATNGKKLMVNESFADSMSDAELRGVLVHEVSHLAYGHHVRRGDRDPKVWNEAADYAINRDIMKAGFELPPCRLFNAAYDGMSAEQIYADLAKTKGNSGNKQGPGAPSPSNGTPQQSDPGQCGQIIDAGQPGDPASLQEEKAKWEAKTFSAAAVAKAMGGELPDGIERLLGVLRAPPKVSWRDKLRDFVDSCVEKESTWSRPDRRYISQGLYLPGSEGVPAGNILSAVDCSGSVDDTELAEAGRELQNILECGVAEKLTVIYCDTELGGEVEYEPGEEITLRIPHSGGTDFAPVMEWAPTKEEGTCLIYFTDLYCNSYGEDPGIPVLWVTTSEHYNAPPFGEVIVMDAHDR